MFADEDTSAESEMLMAARRNGLVTCPRCKSLVEEEMLGVSCEICGADGCENCIVPGPDGRWWTCADPADCVEGV